MDAMHCQKETVAAVVEKGADYVISLKGNQPQLLEKVERFFKGQLQNGFVGPHDFTEDTDKDHGRIEVRRCWTSSHVTWLAELKDWEGLSSFGLIESERHLSDGKVETEHRYFLSSLPGDDAQKFLSTVRTHWAVENQLHWTLDVAFREDDARMRKDYAPENAAVLRQISLNLLKGGTHIRYDDGSVKKTPGIKARRKMAGWDHDWLLHLLGFHTPRSPLPG
jgi:predicted transposase YbfD/YdcC